ncbi:unnamed protein product [Macrosiphum euphorbiae]|uniref:Peptidase M14 domain-containing protein n=1 Tax=Macrosiphum euphorbiae TaxID=13131 RepID=A0AAV0X648_9HEMI|nr:unnamed protein product [Macrosiphum euphorbiae]
MANGSACQEEHFKNGITNGAEWYELEGGMQDFNYIYSNCFEITIELTCCKFPSPSVLTKEWEYNRESLLTYMESVHMGIKGLVQDENNNPIPGATIHIVGINHTVKTTNRGEYWRLLLPGIYNISANAPGYNASVYRNILVKNDTLRSTTVNFTLHTLKQSSELIDFDTSNVVIDLSHWNVNVDFGLAKSNGTVAVIHKATQGIRNIDSCYRTRRIAAEKEGLLWGAYHFGTNTNGVIQANHFLNQVGNTSATLLVLNVEPYKNKIMTQKQAEDFINTVQNVTKNFVMIYASYNTLKNYSTPFLLKTPLWIALYNTQLKLPPGWDKWVLWQYTDGKKGLWPHGVNGVGLCDRDKFNGSVDRLRAFWPNGSLPLL